MITFAQHLKNYTMVRIFKTDIGNSLLAEYVLDSLMQLFPSYRINFDLEDCDKILRIEGGDFEAEKVVSVVSSRNFVCVELL